MLPIQVHKTAYFNLLRGWGAGIPDDAVLVLNVLGIAVAVDGTWFWCDPLVPSPGGVGSSIDFMISNPGGGHPKN